MPVDYKLGKIYKIVNDVNATIYVGSSAQKTLSARMGNHRSDIAKPHRRSPLHMEMRQLGIEHFRIVLLHAFPCDSKEELEAEEYKTLNAFRSAGVPLYNCMFDGKPDAKTREKQSKSQTGRIATPETREKMSNAALGRVFTPETREKISAAKFSFGSISIHKCTSWVFSWEKKINGKSVRYTKSFSIHKYGDFGAHFRAEEARRAIYPEWGNEEDNTCDDFGEIEWD